MRSPIRTNAAFILVSSMALMVSCIDPGAPAGPRDAAVVPRTDSGATTTTDAGSDRCASDLTDCDGSCIDTMRDFANCGACGQTCDAGAVCAAGVCGGTCPDATTSCGGSCIDTTSDPRHCGGCGVACGAVETCEAGACVGCGTGISFASDVQPILTRTCLGPACHGGMRPAGDLSLESGRAYAAMVGVASSCSDGRLLVAPGDAGESYLVHKITNDRICTGNRMPLGGTGLTAAEIATISDWVCGGARDD